MDIDGRMAQANGRLKAAAIRVQIRRKGDKLYLRATFPPQPGETNRSQRDLALGISANPIGLKLAEAKAKEIGGLLDAGQFDWLPYLKVEPAPIPQDTIGEWVEKFTQNYFESRSQTPTKLNTFKKEFTAIFRHLPAEELLSADQPRRVKDCATPVLQPGCQNFNCGM